MKQEIGCMKEKSGEPIDDLDIVLLALYNLLYEKMQEEPEKGITACKGLPNQRRVKWSKVMTLAHVLGDYFAVKKVNGCGDCCQNCRNWRSVSKASPHLGKCDIRSDKMRHAFDTCKKYKRKEEEET